ncbi:MAG: hypothetical protein ABW051_07620, partial [Burkholderiaceae bacterium]
AMRRFFLAAVLLPFAAHAVQDCTLNGEHVSPSNGNTTAGKTGLMRCVDRDTKQLEREQELKDGKFMGLVRYFREGKLAREHSVNEKGNRHGRAREFAANGQATRDEVYENGSTVGLARTFHESGQPQRATFYGTDGREQASVEFTERGQLSSLRCGDKPLLAPAADDAKLCGFGSASAPVEFFSSRGQLRSRVVHLNGKRLKAESFFDNGKPSQVDETVGTQHTSVRYTPEGLKRVEIVSAVTDTRTMRELQRDYSERGTLAREQRWSRGELAGDDTFYLNGQPKSRTTYAREGDRIVSEVRQFHDSGKLASEGRYAQSGRYRELALGTHKYYAEDGRLAGESVYDDKGRLSRQRAWDEAGKLVRDEEVFEDGSRKAFSR